MGGPLATTTSQDIENLLFGRTNSFGGTSPAYLALATGVVDATAKTFTEPATADGYQRLALASDFDAATSTNISNAIGLIMATASAPWAEIRWAAICASGTRGAADAKMLDCIIDPSTPRASGSVETVDYYNVSATKVLPAGTWLCRGHQFHNGDLITARLANGQQAGGVTYSIAKQYAVTGADISKGIFTITEEDGTAVTITSPGQAMWTKVQPIAAGSVSGNVAVTSDIRGVSFAVG